ncbi:hypothetical protein QBZ16_000183 [Prototheca wickerhamii]|uniref:Uncharacterized protein n=1 Tax=Prototheca wickerhamii TaxID=3111 RepID=A0AAD9INS4_PROWI|nr:hypothetical protein QBZ16_000183 [Prototheca wickerhamii]
MCRSPWISAALRYNQRGVGASTGSRQLRGGKDFLDVLDMVDHLSNELPPSPDNKVVVVGYSWGSCVAVHALKQPLAGAYVGLSFPLGGLSAVLGTRSHFAMLAQTSHVPRLLIMGSQDSFTGEAAIKQSVLSAPGGPFATRRRQLHGRGTGGRF